MMLAWAVDDAPHALVLRVTAVAAFFLLLLLLLWRRGRRR